MIHLNISGVQNTKDISIKKSQQFINKNSNAIELDSFTRVSFQGLFSDPDDKKSTFDLTKEAFSKDSEKILLKAMKRDNFNPNYDAPVKGTDKRKPVLLECIDRKWEKAANKLAENPKTNINVAVDGIIPVHRAIETYNYDLFDRLLVHENINGQQDLDVNIRDSNGNTPLIKAAIYQDQYPIRCLLLHPKVNKDEKNNDGVTAAQIDRNANGWLDYYTYKERVKKYKDPANVDVQVPLPPL